MESILVTDEAGTCQCKCADTNQKNGPRTYDVDFLKRISEECIAMESRDVRLRETQMLTDYITSVYDESTVGDFSTYNIRPPVKWDALSINDKEASRSLDDVIGIFDDLVMRTGNNRLIGTNFKFCPSSQNYLASVGAALGAFLPKWASIYKCSPGGCEIDLAVVRWLCRLVGYGEESHGYITTGTSAANVHAFVVAREEKISLEKMKRSVIYLTEHVHMATFRAMKVVGLHECIVRKVPTDNCYKMDASTLRNTIKSDIEAGLIPALVVCSLGTVDCGVIDPIHEVADICRNNGIWLHVDAALGGPLLVIDHVRHLARGVELSDSISLDCHKIQFQPVGVGVILLRQGRQLYNAMKGSSPNQNYLDPCTETYSPMDYSFELSRPIRGLSMWISVKVLGTDFFERLFQEKLQLAKYLYHKIQLVPHMEALMEPELIVVLFRYIPPGGNTEEVNKKLVEHYNKNTKVVLHGAIVKDSTFLRVCVSSFRSHIEDIDILVEDVASVTRDCI